MKLDITQLLGGKERVLRFPIRLDAAETEYAGFFSEDVRLISPIGGEVTVSDRGEYISVEVSPRAEYELPCSRCLTPVKGTLEVTFERIIPSGSSFAFDEELCDEEDILTVTEGQIDLTEAIIEETALRIPDYVLCGEECLGLCPKCGKKLSEGDCGCAETKEIDPRMKIFEKLLKDEE